jgi:hypothetical protein
MADTPVVIPEPAAPVAEVAVIQAPPVRLTLYDLEEQLVALGDTTEMVEPEQEQAFLEQFQASLKLAVEKRDRVGQFMSHLENQMQFADAEMVRLQERKAYCGRALDRISSYVTMTIKSLGQDAKGKWKKLEGKVTTFSLAKCPASVNLTDADAVPAQYKSVTITLPLELYDKLLDSLDLDFAGQIADSAKKARIDVSKTAVKESLKAKVDVPGAVLVDDKYRLERR